MDGVGSQSRVSVEQRLLQSTVNVIVKNTHPTDDVFSVPSCNWVFQHAENNYFIKNLSCFKKILLTNRACVRCTTGMDTSEQCSA